MIVIKKRQCAICGRIEDDHHRIRFNKKIKQFLCDKHRNQIRRYGKITDKTQGTIKEPNTYIIEENYAKIIIKNNKQEIKAEVMIDIEDVEKCKMIKWYITDKGYIESAKHIKIHRYILGYEGSLFVDHINRNKLDNRKENLRIVSIFLNNQNNGAAGVSFDKHANKWKAEYQLYGQYFNAGTFDTKEEAIEARKFAIEKTNKNKEALLKQYLERDKDHATGVRPSPHGRWIAKFCAENKTFHVGTFDTKEEAVVAREKALLAYFKTIST